MQAEAQVSRREIGKAQRRRRIIEAAASLVREFGFDEVSMVQIAERAGVSPGTLYNLFQTKSAIFREVFDLDLDEFVQALDRASSDPLDKLFVAVSMAAGLYRREPRFYRAMAFMSRSEGERFGHAITDPRVAFWQERVRDIASHGLLLPGTNVPLLGATVARFARGIFIEWATGSIDADRLDVESHFALASLLAAHATASTRRRLVAQGIAPRQTMRSG